jgi:hypothetical protein
MDEQLELCTVGTHSTLEKCDDVARNLDLVRVNDEFYVTSKPVVELNNLANKQQVINNIVVDQQLNLWQKIKIFNYPLKLILM